MRDRKRKNKEEWLSGVSCVLFSFAFTLFLFFLWIKFGY